jgi:hypothetical protein
VARLLRNNGRSTARLQGLLERLGQVRQRTIELITEAADDKAPGKPVPNRKASKKKKRRPVRP